MDTIKPVSVVGGYFFLRKLAAYAKYSSKKMLNRGLTSHSNIILFIKKNFFCAKVYLPVFST